MYILYILCILYILYILCIFILPYIETGVFLYLGLAVFTINKYFDLALVIWSVVLILIGRAANIFPLTALVNCCRSVKISIRMQCIMWYSGMWNHTH